MTLQEKKKFVDDLVGAYRFHQRFEGLSYSSFSQDFESSSLQRISTPQADWKIFYSLDEHKFGAVYEGGKSIVSGSYTDLENTTKDLETLSKYVLKDTLWLKATDISDPYDFLCKFLVASAAAMGGAELFVYSHYFQGLEETNKMMTAGLTAVLAGVSSAGVTIAPQYLQHLYVASKLSPDASTYSSGITELQSQRDFCVMR